MKNAKQVRKYYNSIASGYDNLYVDNLSQAENEIVAEMLFQKVLSLNKKSVRILDLGCGTGLGYEMIQSQCLKLGIKIEYVGLDISEEMIRIANKKFNRVTNVNFVVGNMNELRTLESNNFDLVCSIFGSFSHTDDYNHTLDEIKRILRRNGKLFLMVYSRFSFRNICKAVFRFKWKKLAFKQSYDVRNNHGKISCGAYFFCKGKMTQLFNKRRFKVDRISGLNIFFEIPLFKPFVKDSKKAFDVLKSELKFGKILPNLGHSLIIEGTCLK